MNVPKLNKTYLFTGQLKLSNNKIINCDKAILRLTKSYVRVGHKDYTLNVFYGKIDSRRITSSPETTEYFEADTERDTFKKFLDKVIGYDYKIEDGSEEVKDYIRIQLKLLNDRCVDNGVDFRSLVQEYLND